VRWEQLGYAGGPGEYVVPGVGIVQVTEQNIAEAKQIESDPSVTLIYRGRRKEVLVYSIGSFLRPNR
jgi:hypothetical protein